MWRDDDIGQVPERRVGCQWFFGEHVKVSACEVVTGAIRARGGEAIALACNIGRKGDCEALIAATQAKWGRVDVLVCNAAINPYFGPAAGIADEVFDKVMASNIKSNLWLSNLVIPGMAERGGGAVIIISSIGGLRGSALLGAYAISKAADMQLARNIAIEWGHKNIRANAIAPGLVRTDFARALWENPDIYKKRTRDTPLRRIGEPDEIGGAAVFLASSAGSYMTGQTLAIDGGVTAGAPLTDD